MGTGSLLHSHSVCVLQKKDYPIVTDMNPLTVAAKASITHVQHYTCTVKARSVGVWRQISDMASFWIRPEYVVDYRPILDAPVDAAGEVVEEIMLYCC